VKHGDTTEIINVTPVPGLIASDPNRVALGVALALVENKSYGLFAAMYQSVIMTWNGLVNITVGLTTLIVQSISGTADLSQVAGPVGIVGMVGDAASFGVVALLTFTAMISLNLAVINMLPVPALDGGRLVFVAIEAVTRKKINPIWMSRVNLVGFALLMLLMIAVTWSDIAKLI
jgi:regulator of sigma E protease